MSFATIGGVTLHHRHRHRGQDTLLVFINSLGTDFRIWEDVAAAFEADYATLCYDKRGHGLSDLVAPPYSIGDHVDDLSGLIDHVGARHVVLCGLSVGGLIAQGLYAKRPDIVRALILCDTAHKIGTQDSWNTRIATVREKGLPAIADGVMKLWFTPVFHAERQAELAGCRNMLSRQSVEGYNGTCAALREADHTELVKRIAVPTLCLVGDQDGSTPPTLVKSMADLIPGSEFTVIAGAGHIPCIERPAEMVALMKDFLGRKLGHG